MNDDHHISYGHESHVAILIIIIIKVLKIIKCWSYTPSVLFIKHLIFFIYDINDVFSLYFRQDTSIT